MEQKIDYFQKAGKLNTEKTLRLAKERTETLNLKKVVLASSNGYTARMALKIFQDTTSN